MPDKVRITVTFEMDVYTARMFLSSALERVVNTSIRIISKHPNDENQGINLEDWEEWKPVVSTLWSAIHDAVYRKMGHLPDSERVYQLRKGDV